MRLRHTAAATVLALSPTYTAWAQHTSYEGVVPGSGNAAPRAEAAVRSRGRAVLTWTGFQPLAAGASRFFVQSTRPIEPHLTTRPGRVEVLFPRATVHLRNSTLWLETANFESPVTRARLERRGRDMVLVLFLRAEVRPSLSSAPGEGNYQFTYIDFPSGQWLPAAPPDSGNVGQVRAEPTHAAAPARSEPPPRWSGPSDSRGSQLGREASADDERPPPVEPD